MEHPDFGEICECECHRDGCDITHFDACCRFCYQKYISAGGVVDIARFGELIMNERLAAKGKAKRR